MFKQFYFIAASALLISTAQASPFGECITSQMRSDFRHAPCQYSTAEVHAQRQCLPLVESALEERRVNGYSDREIRSLRRALFREMKASVLVATNLELVRCTEADPAVAAFPEPHVDKSF